MQAALQLECMQALHSSTFYIQYQLQIGPKVRWFWHTIKKMMQRTRDGSYISTLLVYRPLRKLPQNIQGRKHGQEITDVY